MASEAKTFGFVALLHFCIILDVSGQPTATINTPSMRSKMASPPQQKRCDEFYFYDHGTDHCEHCRDICEHAGRWGTMNQCREKCQSYALSLWPPNPDSRPFPPDKGNDKTSDSAPFPLEAKITLPILACILVVAGVLLGLVFVRRRRNRSAKKNRKPLARAQGRVVEEIEMDPLDDTTRENRDGSMSTAASWRATQGTGTFVSTGGIQEEGVGSMEGGSQAEGRGTVVVQATPSVTSDNLAENPRFPVMVSSEGHSASFAVALPQSPMMPRAITRPNLQRPVPRPDSDVDLDSTELKTLLPSMSDDSLLSGACGGQSSACGL